LHGACLGVGAEIALAARGRVAAGDLRFGLRDVLVGRLPGAGGTQTLPRLVGAAEALRLIGRGVTVSAAEALERGIVDAVVADPVTAGVAMALAPPEKERAAGLRDGRAYQAAVAAARKVDGGDALQAGLADCVEAAQLLPLDQGLVFEAEAAAEVGGRPEAGALQHLVMAEMRMLADLGGGAAAGRIGFWGAGAGALVWPALHAGLEVVFADDDRAALLAEVEKVALAQEEQVAAGRMTAAARDAEWARLTPGVAVGDLAGAELVIAAKPGAVGDALHLGVWAEQAGDAARLLLVSPGFGELQLPGRGDAFGLRAAATLRRMRIRFAVTAAPPAGGVARALVRAARSACTALLTLGISHSSIAAALEGYLRLPLPDDLGGSTVMPAVAVRARVDGALAAAGMALLTQGAVRRAGDVDVLAVTALGLPRTMGGPMFAAEQRGLMLLRRDLQGWANEHAVWTPPALLDQLISDGARLSRYVVAKT
ncbi:MAG: enoyl-CoA hydratase-related protein, partial [Paracoccaceae bacterium]